MLKFEGSKLFVVIKVNCHTLKISILKNNSKVAAIIIVHSWQVYDLESAMVFFD